MKNRFLTLLVLLSLLTISARAGQQVAIVLKNGSKLQGNILVQRPGLDITIAAEKAIFIIEETTTTSRRQKNVRYEDLSREWKRWSLEQKALQGNADGRYLPMFDIRTKDYTYISVAKIEQDEAPKIRYIQVTPTTYKVKWKDIYEIQKQVPMANETTGVDDEVTTLAGKTYQGTIVSQKPTSGLSIKTESVTVALRMDEVLEIRKVARSKSLKLYEQAGFVNTIVLKNGTDKEGIILVQHYGKKAQEQYISLLHRNGNIEKVQTSDISEYRTAYHTEKSETYVPGQVYVNEFRLSKAKTATEAGKTAYIDRKVFPFPEGIVITFKANGAKFQGTWKLIALSEIYLANGRSTQGYTTETLKENSITPSTIDISGSTSSISFNYLSPGYYALVTNDTPESYIIKIIP